MRKKKAKNNLLYDLVPTKDGKHIFRLNKNSKFDGVKFKLSGIEYEEDGPIIHYDVVRCPKKYDLKNRDFREFDKEMESILLSLLQNAVESSKDETNE